MVHSSFILVHVLHESPSSGVVGWPESKVALGVAKVVGNLYVQASSSVSRSLVPKFRG